MATSGSAGARSARSTTTARPGRGPFATSASGEYRRRLRAAGLAVDEDVYAPFGDDPLLLHDVTIANTTPARAARELVRVLGRQPLRPADQAAPGARRAAVRPRDAHPHRRPEPPAGATSADPLAARDRRPLTIFAAALRGPGGGHATDATRFFGAGGRARPGRGGRGPARSGAGARGRRRPHRPHAVRLPRAGLRLRPGAHVTLRYAYGAAAAVRRAPRSSLATAARRDPLAASRHAWAALAAARPLSAARPG